MDTNERIKALTTSEPTPHRDQTEGTADHARMETRRAFLTKVSIGVGAVGGVVLLAPLVGFLVGPLVTKPAESWQPLGSVDSYLVGTTVEVRLEDSSSLPWAGLTSQSAAWLRRISPESTAAAFVAYAVNCTHLGCPVSWLPDANLFECPCHGGVYYSDGSVAAGPPPYPLAHYPVRITDGILEIHSTGIPITTDG